MYLDWQNEFHEIKERGAHLLQSQKWSDCSFVVGTSPNQRTIAGHKLILAMASPVFECMFYGQLADKSDRIIIPDVQPDAFQSMLEYIYADRINIQSFDKACELCYVAKKYMLPHIVEQCTQYLWLDLNPRNACRAYEFAKLFDEPRLIQKSMELIAAFTKDVINDPNFLDIDMSTLMDILNQDKLNIDSEIDLFNALEKFANERCTMHGPADIMQTNPMVGCNNLENQNATTKDVDINDLVEVKMEPDINAMVQGEEAAVCEQNDDDSVARCSSTSSVIVLERRNSIADVDVQNIEDISKNRPAENSLIVASSSSAAAAAAAAVVAAAVAATTSDISHHVHITDTQRSMVDEVMMREAIKKIRFLTLTPQQFAEGPARSRLLQQHEALSILIKISSPAIDDCPMPDGFNDSRCCRNYIESRNQREALTRRAMQNSNDWDSDESAPRVYSKFSKRTEYQLHVPPRKVVASRAVNNSQESDETRLYCNRTLNQHFDFHNTSVSDSHLTFQVDSNIWISGVEVPTQVHPSKFMNATDFGDHYTEILYAHVQDMHGSRLSYTHYTSRVRYSSRLEVSFDHPVYIKRNKPYKIFITFNKVGWYPIFDTVTGAVCSGIGFKFNVGDPNESMREGLIRSIVFTIS